MHNPLNEPCHSSQISRESALSGALTPGQWHHLPQRLYYPNSKYVAVTTTTKLHTPILLGNIHGNPGVSLEDLIMPGSEQVINGGGENIVIDKPMIFRIMWPGYLDRQSEVKPKTYTRAALGKEIARYFYKFFDVNRTATCTVPEWSVFSGRIGPENLRLVDLTNTFGDNWQATVEVYC